MCQLVLCDASCVVCGRVWVVSLGWGVVLIADHLLVEGLECNMVTGNGVRRLRQAVGAVTSRWGSSRFPGRSGSALGARSTRQLYRTPQSDNIQLRPGVPSPRGPQIGSAQRMR